MAATYTSLVGKRIDVVYRFGEIDLFARGTLIADTGETIQIEQNADQYGAFLCFPLRIPYRLILRLKASHRPCASSST